MNISTIESMISALEKPAIFITTDYKILAVNQAYKDTYELPVEIGKSHCYEISHGSSLPCDQVGEDCPLKRCKETKKTQSALHIHQTDKGRSYCDILMRPVIDDDGITIGFLEIVEGVTYASHKSEANKIVGISDTFKNLLSLINRSAKSEISILLHGETGTGKELVANAVHAASKHKNEPFVVVECTGLSESLFESELFGYERGAFTGANSSKKGLIEAVNGGTLFLDEIGDIPMNQQVKLLRLLETGTYRSVGGLEVKKANFRLVCATHKNLREMIDKNEFREDLYYRIAGFPIELPSLRERLPDIPLLAQHFLSLSEFHSKRFSEQALLCLQRYSFPGNIRELRNIVERAALMADEDEIDIEHLPAYVVQEAKSPSPVEHKPLNSLEETYLAQLCTEYAGRSEELAQHLGISRRTLYRKLKKYGLSLRTT